MYRPITVYNSHSQICVVTDNKIIVDIISRRNYIKFVQNFSTTKDASRVGGIEIQG